MSSRTHEYKVWPMFFQVVVDGIKTFEWRRDDRKPCPMVGDIFHGREWSPSSEKYTGREFHRTITYIIRGAVSFGMPPGFAIYGFGRKDGAQ